MGIKLKPRKKITLKPREKTKSKGIINKPKELKDMSNNKKERTNE